MNFLGFSSEYYGAKDNNDDLDRDELQIEDLIRQLDKDIAFQQAIIHDRESSRSDIRQAKAKIRVINRKIRKLTKR